MNCTALRYAARNRYSAEADETCAEKHSTFVLEGAGGLRQMLCVVVVFGERLEKGYEGGYVVFGE
jgi:hypothetical protein